MTREHKLALIVGFSLVLVLGVLISDHFSKARVVEGSEDLQPEAARQVGAAPPGIRLASDQMTTLPPLPGQGQSAFSSSQPTIPLPQSNPTPPPAATFEIVNDPSIRRSDIPAELANRMQMVPSSGLDSLPGTNPVSGGAVVLTPTPAEPVSTLPFSTGQMKRHDIKEGDSLYSLAKSTYGDGRLWEKLRDFNKGKITADGAVREGVTIILPPKDVLLGKAAMPDPKTAAAGIPIPPGSPSAVKPGAGVTTPKADAKPEVKAARPDSRVTSAAGTPSPASVSSTSSGFTTYTVQKGDYLETVAKKLLGSPNRWPEIVEANKSTLPDPESLKIGMTLRIPREVTSVFAKIAALIVSIGVVACVLLGIRQMRIQAAAETALVQRRVAEHDRTLWRLRLEIASRVTPGQIEKQVLAFGALRPINPERYQELVSAEAKAAGAGGDSTVTVNANP